MIEQLPAGIRSRVADSVNGLDLHYLESGDPAAPCIALLHGFPEIAFSWRKVMVPLADAGYHVVAPDQRGYGQTTGWDADYDADLSPFRLLNRVIDVLALVTRLGHDDAELIVGHDHGAAVAGWAALIRPDVFRRLALMSAPFGGAPPRRRIEGPADDIHGALAALPRPRKHYARYYTTRPANDDMMACEQGVHDFLRAYFHHKSADWAGNEPFPLPSWTAEEVAQMPTYYIMDQDETMPQTVAHHMPTAEQVAACEWLTEEELAVYSGAYRETGFQGGLNWYRAGGGAINADLSVFAGQRVSVPSMFVAGASDWGPRQRFGALEHMCDHVLANLVGCHLVDGAGHWVQQEKPAEVIECLTRLLKVIA